MHESCPACGGRTSVGTTALLAPAGEKSRRRAIGASNTISFVEVHDGARRLAISSSQCGTSNGAGDPVSAAAKQSASPSSPTDQPSSQLFSSPEVNVVGPSAGGQYAEAF